MVMRLLIRIRWPTIMLAAIVLALMAGTIWYRPWVRVPTGSDTKFVASLTTGVFQLEFVSEIAPTFGVGLLPVTDKQHWRWTFIFVEQDHLWAAGIPLWSVALAIATVALAGFAAKCRQPRAIARAAATLWSTPLHAPSADAQRHPTKR
jgi:hypothetical protein